MSGESLDDTEVADSAVSATSNQDKSMSDSQLENNLVKSVELEDGKAEETIGNATGGEKTLTDNNDGKHTKMSDLNGDYMVKLHQNTSEDEDDEDDDLWEDDDDDSEEDDEETAIDQDEASEEEETDVEDSEGDNEDIAYDQDVVSNKDVIEEKEENAAVEKEIANKDERKTEEQNVEKVEAKLNVNKSKGKREKNMAREEISKKPDTTAREESSKKPDTTAREESSKKPDTTAREESSKKPDTTEKSKSLTKKKTKKRVESMGMIFMCSSITKNDCFKYMVLGQPESKKNMVEKIYPGMRLFLYDVDLRLMYGIFKAQERGGYNIEPKAFKSKFPSQVRFTVLTDCLPVPEERFKKVIKENYFTKKKFDCQLNSEQVKSLCKLFKSTSKGQQPKKLPRSRKLEKRPIPIRQEGSRKRRAENERRLPERKEIRYIERPCKRPRKARSPVARSHQPLPPPLSVPLTAMDRNLDVDRRDPYFESRSRDTFRQDPYESRRDRPIERRDPYLERSREPYRDGRDLYLDRRDPYRDGRDPRLGLDLRAPCTDTRDPYSDRRIPYRDGLDLYSDSRDLYRDDRSAYIERRVYTDNDPYRRDPLTERRYVYRDDRGEEVYREPYRSRGVLDRPLSLESRRRYEVVSQDPYASYRPLPSNAEPFYSAQYPSRTYRL